MSSAIASAKKRRGVNTSAPVPNVNPASSVNNSQISIQQPQQNQKTTREQAIKYLRNQGLDFQNEQLVDEYEKVFQFIKDPTELLLH